MPYETNVVNICPYLSQNSGVTVELSNIDFSIDTIEENIYFSKQMNDSGLTTELFRCNPPYLAGIIFLTQLINVQMIVRLPVIQNSYLITIWHFL